MNNYVNALMMAAAAMDPSVSRALRNIQKRNQEALRPKTAQDMENISKAQAKQERKALRKQENTRST